MATFLRTCWSGNISKMSFSCRMYGDLFKISFTTCIRNKENPIEKFTKLILYKLSATSSRSFFNKLFVASQTSRCFNLRLRGLFPTFCLIFFENDFTSSSCASQQLEHDPHPSGVLKSPEEIHFYVMGMSHWFLQWSSH